MIIEQLEAIFHPRSIAVVGASKNPFAMGYRYVLHLKNYGYNGQIYPVSPNCSEVLGYKVYPSLKEISGPVDYVICCLPAAKVLDLLTECQEKQVKAVHLFTGRLSETGIKDAAELEKEILRQARKLGVRIIGPNCMGLYSPDEGIAFGYDFPTETGELGMFLQSGGAATEFVYYSVLRGIRFSKVVSYGNALDLNETDYLKYLLHDDDTKIIASYIEGVNDGGSFFSALKQAALLKPVVVLKAGRSSAGIRQAASHTASLAGSQKTWGAAIKQAGAIQAHSLEEMTDLVISFYFLPPISGTRVGIVGGGGGRSVLSADEWEEAGFSVVPLPQEIKEEVKKTLPEMWWDWIKNPVDVSIFPEKAFATNLSGKILKMMSKSPQFDLLIVNLTVGGPFSSNEFVAFIGNEVRDIIEISKTGKKPIVVVMNTGTLDTNDFNDVRWKCLAKQKARLIEAKVPFYSNTEQAAKALIKLVGYYQRKDLGGVEAGNVTIG